MCSDGCNQPQPMVARAAVADTARYGNAQHDSTASYRRACMQAGASWFLDKSTEFDELKEVVIGCIGRDSPDRYESH
jgi:hypothetical protein